MASTVEAAMDAVIETGRLLGAAGLAPGTTGNISVRVGEQVLVTGTGARLGSLSADDLAVLGTGGAPVRGAKPTKESVLHLRCYAVRPDVGAIVHLHSPAALAASCIDDLPVDGPLPVYTPYYAMRTGRVRLVDYFAPGDEVLADAVSAAARDADAVLLRRHGSVCLGRDLAGAAASAEELEANADIHLRLAGRKVTPLNADEIAALAHWRKQ